MTRSERLIVYEFFFFQAEDGIRDRNVTGVQTCALPIFSNPEMYEAMNDVFTKPDEPITNILQTYQKRDDDRSLLYVDNMNTPRFSNNFADQGRDAETTWKMALAYLYFTPGVPMIY